MSVKAMPDQYQTVTPYLLVNEVEVLIDFLKNVFNAHTTESMSMKNGKIAHASVKIGDSIVMIGAQPGEHDAAMLYIYVNDVDSIYQTALANGAKSLMEPADQFYGDRNAGIEGPCGHRWWLACHIEDVPSNELKKRAEDFYQ